MNTRTALIHLSWMQTTTGKQIWEIHHTPKCQQSCEDKIRNWGVAKKVPLS